MRTVSFFSGALGLDVGLERAGAIPLGYCEVDPVVGRTIRRNRPDVPLLATDIRTLSPRSIRDELGQAAQGADLIVGGPPCQAFSTAGKRNSLADERGHVFLHFLDLAVALAPRLIVIENVRGLLSAPLRHRPHAQRGPGFPALSADELAGGALRHVVQRLESAGYGVTFRLYDTSRFGVPQVRERVVLIAAADHVRVPHLNPLAGPAPTVRQALEGLESVDHEFLPLRDRQAKYVAMLSAGQNWRSLPLELQPEALGGVYACGGGRTGFLRRIAWDKPAPTLVTAPTMPATLLAHPEALRPLSVQEYRRLQTFPDNFAVEGSTAQKYKQLGNAVPVTFGEAIGHHLQVALGRTARPTLAVVEAGETSRYRGTDERSWSAAAGH